jgi:hypothetical protein
MTQRTKRVSLRYRLALLALSRFTEVSQSKVYIGSVPHEEYWVRMTPHYFHKALWWAITTDRFHGGSGSTCFTLGHVHFWNDYPAA